MNKLISLLLLLLIFPSCNDDSAIDTMALRVEEQCKSWEQEACRKCDAGETDEFKICYYDTNKFKDPRTVREDCIAVHVGHKCEPCESIFALNFAGAMREVNCKDFFQAIEKRNSKCKGCIKPSTVLQ